jgi:TonB family protein
MTWKEFRIHRHSCARFVLLVACGLALVLFQSLLAQQDSTSKRKLVEHAKAAYPPMARSMALEGVVKVDAVVAPDGTVKSVDVKGGHPVLAQAAVNTVRQWRWEPAAHDTHELVEVKFSPGD